MAVAVYSTDLIDIFTDGTTTGWTALGGGASALSQETDYYIQGISCLSKAAFASAEKGMIFGGATATIPTDGAVFIWVTHQTANSLNTIANGGLQVLLGSSASAYKQYYIGGSDTIKYDNRWLCIPVNPTILANLTTGVPTAVVSFYGTLANMVGGPTKGAPLAVDAIRYGRGIYSYVSGDLANGYANFLNAAAFNDDVTRAYGQIQLSGGVFKLQGLHSLGTSVTPVDFRDSNRSMVISDTLKVTPAFNSFTINNAASNVLWTNININSLGAVSRGNFTVIDNAVVLLDTCVLTDMGLFVLASNTTLLNTTLRRSDRISLNNGTITSCTIDRNINATSILATTLDFVTDTSFISKGTGYAVELNSLGAGSMNWKNTLTGYPSVNGVTGNEAIFVNVASGNLTINVFAGYSTPSIRTAGAVVTLVIAPVTTTITVSDVSTGAVIQNARVLVEAFSGGSENYRSSVTITNTTNTATVTQSNHGLVTGRFVRIIGANQQEYNGVKTVTVTGVNTYTFTTTGSPVSPATGTISSTTVFINNVTDSLGRVSVTRSFSSNQPIRGRARKSTTPILYKSAPIVATINSASGLDLTVQMIPD
jgi:hypothetical protein